MKPWSGWRRGGGHTRSTGWPGSTSLYMRSRRALRHAGVPISTPCVSSEAPANTFAPSNVAHRIAMRSMTEPLISYRRCNGSMAGEVSVIAATRTAGPRRRAGLPSDRDTVIEIGDCAQADVYLAQLQFGPALAGPGELRQNQFLGRNDPRQEVAEVDAAPARKLRALERGVLDGDEIDPHEQVDDDDIHHPPRGNGSPHSVGVELEIGHKSAWRVSVWAGSKSTTRSISRVVRGWAQ